MFVDFIGADRVSRDRYDAGEACRVNHAIIVFVIGYATTRARHDPARS